MKNDNKILGMNWFQSMVALVICVIVASIEIMAALEISIYNKTLITRINSVMYTLLLIVVSYLDRRRLKEVEEKIYKPANIFFLVVAISSIVAWQNHIKINPWICAAMFIWMSVGILVAMFFNYKKRMSPAITPPMKS